MKRSLIAAAALLMMATAAQAAAKSDYVTLKSKGHWSAYYTVSNMGNPLCGMQTSWSNDRRKTIAWAHLKYTAGDVITVQLFKTSWRIPEGTTANVAISFDDGQQFPAAAKSGNVKDDAYLQFVIARGTEADFLGLIAGAKELKISFPDGDEPPWVSSMTGSRDVSDAFARCAYTLDKNASAASSALSGPDRRRDGSAMTLPVLLSIVGGPSSPGGLLS